MRTHALFALLVSFVPSAIAVFADDAYHTDYHHPLVGIPQEHNTFFHRPQASSRASLLYTLSEKLILGAINPKDGAVVWRQFLNPSSNLTSSTEGFLRAGENENTVISAVGSQISAWDALDGRLAWRNEFADGVAKDLEVIEFEDGKAKKSGKDAVVLFEGDHAVVRRISGETGDVLWEHRDGSGGIPHQLSTSNSNIYLVSLSSAGRAGLKIKVTSLDPVSGRERNHYALSSEADVSTPQSILFVGANSASPIIAWSDKASKVLKVNVIGSKHISSIDIPNENGEDIKKIRVHAPHITRSLPHFLVHYQSETRNWAEVYHINLSTSTVSKAYSLPKLAGPGAFSTSTQDANVFFTRNTENELLLLSSTSHGVLARWETASAAAPQDGVAEKEHPLHGVSEVISRPDSSYAVRSALVSSAGDWNLVRNGKAVWKRTEALAGAVAAEWAELPELKDLARELEVEVHENILAAYIHRVKRHVRDLQHFPKWIEYLPTRILGALSGDEKIAESAKGFNRDSFGFRKLVIVATETGRLYALSVADQGQVIWNIKAADLKDGERWDVTGMYADNAEGLMIVQIGSGENIVVETTTGRVVSASLEGSDTGRKWFTGANEGDPVLLSSGLVPRKNITVIARGPNGEVRGKRYAGDGFATTAWEFAPSAGERIAELTVRPFHDPVASIGRVLGDRSVMYKYLNPNLLLITTVSDAKYSATLTLLDSVSGNILYTTTHHGVDTTRPIVSALSENWFIYSFWGDVVPSSDRSSPPAQSSKGYRLVTTTLYESPLPNDRGPLGPSKNFSSTSPPSTPPFIKSQAYLIPSALSALAITSTRQGITSRQIIAFLADTHAIIAIPKLLLNPSRPIDRDPTPAEAEEGLSRYQPLLEFDPKWIISHKRDVIGAQKIITSPALLESTSLVFAYGIDIFGTRVAPSMAFDILGKGFNRMQLIGTVVALGAGVAFLAPMTLCVAGKSEDYQLEMADFVKFPEFVFRSAVDS
ncbi:hypothetical protein FGG08_004716 [Glutinoglossum americanum]|uniref:ER membrane protein complex subunit 1 n=1 Tax=Glutinoglossum americanum TaxID=1670608 RepID=A0A9P8I1R2_9PEZI|nr:hypothetical protein FGG08_004716 [Glutinoglossum americanum]